MECRELPEAGERRELAGSLDVVLLYTPGSGQGPEPSEEPVEVVVWKGVCPF